MTAPVLLSLTSLALSHGLDLAGMDSSVRPGDDFDGYANGKWNKAAQIPPDRNGWGPAEVLIEDVALRTRTLIEEAQKAKAPAGSDERKVGDFFASFMDEAGIERKGLAPLKADLDAIAAISDRTGLSRVLGAQLRADVDPLNDTNFHTVNVLGLWVAPDFDNPTHASPYLLQGGLVLPDREYYLAADPRMADTREKYKAYVTDMLRLAGQPGPEAAAARILELETQIAKVHVSREDSEDVHKANNRSSLADLQKRAPGVDWKVYFESAGLDVSGGFILWHPTAATGIAALAASAPLQSWRDLLTFHQLDHVARLLPKRFAARWFDFHGTALTGTPKVQDRWKRGVNATNFALGDAVGQLYAKRYFPPEAKLKAQQMVTAIVAAFGKRIDRLDWMAPATKAKAKAKLQTLYVGVGYPDKWIDYAALPISADDLVGNIRQAELFTYRRSLAKLKTGPDPREWAMTPQTVNAVNLPLQNALNFPAAIMQPPYFDMEADAAINFGAMGATIGHEISHSFDDQGSQFDAQGKLANWWSPEDLAHFKSAAERLTAQFDAYRPFPDLQINGKLTLSENIADVAGLAAAHDAWRASLGTSEPHRVQGLSGEQAFFLSFGQSWRDKQRETYQRQLVLTDGHAPARYRAATVRNLDAWYEAFGIKPGQALYLTPAQRVQVW